MGRPYSEDLFTNGFFQLSLNEGESVVFSYPEPLVLLNNNIWVNGFNFSDKPLHNPHTSSLRPRPA